MEFIAKFTYSLELHLTALNNHAASAENNKENLRVIIEANNLEDATITATNLALETNTELLEINEANFLN